MDIVRIWSKELGKAITVINEEEIAEVALEAISNVPVHRFVNWLKKGFDDALPEGTTLAMLLEGEKAEEYDAAIENALDIRDLFDEEELADLEAKFGKKS